MARKKFPLLSRLSPSPLDLQIDKHLKEPMFMLLLHSVHRFVYTYCISKIHNLFHYMGDLLICRRLNDWYAAGLREIFFGIFSDTSKDSELFCLKLSISNVQTSNGLMILDMW